MPITSRELGEFIFKIQKNKNILPQCIFSLKPFTYIVPKGDRRNVNFSQSTLSHQVLSIFHAKRHRLYNNMARAKSVLNSNTRYVDRKNIRLRPQISVRKIIEPGLLSSRRHISSENGFTIIPLCFDQDETSVNS